MKDKLVVVRGGGDMATGTIQALHRAGFAVVVLETAVPSAIRRCVSLSEAVYDGTASVEDVTARLCSLDGIGEVQGRGEIPLIVDPAGLTIGALRPWAVVDAILAKRNTGMNRAMARHTAALGPGFSAGIDVDAVIETMRGHDLGRIIRRGAAKANTGVPGLIGGFGRERVMHSPAGGWFYSCISIGDVVEKGDPLGFIEAAPRTDGSRDVGSGAVPVPASLTGLVRGIIRDAYAVAEGFKLADIDPRREEYANCFTISDKARAVGNAVVTALWWLEQEKSRAAEP